MRDLVTNSRQKIVLLGCNLCDYSCKCKSDLEKHFSTRKHMNMATKGIFVPKVSYDCENCDYHTSNKTDYDKHLSTAKHQRQVLSNSNRKKIENYTCELCQYTSNRKFNYTSHLQSLRHQQKCNEQQNIAIATPVAPQNAVVNETTIDNSINIFTNAPVNMSHPPAEENHIQSINSNMLLQLILENQNIQKKLIERNDNLENKLENMVSKQNELLEVISKKEFTTAITNNTNCNNTTNNTANINIFLNEKCKDAMNINDFVNSIEHSFETLNYVGHNGFVKGITKLITDKCEELTVYERPFHCTDLKRETIYVKVNDVWEKNTSDNKLKEEVKNKYIERVAFDNLKQFSKWQNSPDTIITPDRPKEYDYYFVLAREVNNGKNQEINDEKVFKNLCKYSYLSREMIRDL